mmetsp:Transcript_53563/g.130430  ORF Transcript_53563/g.130430 Transcript_53563/m.130430 type:complete len:160 (+) Transcript_53563:340-819(+)
MTNPKMTMKMKKIHPLVRDLYKRALVVGHDYPLGLDYVRRTWKDALRNPSNCPSCYLDACGQEQQCFDDALTPVPYNEYTVEQEKELHKAVGKGRFMIREMIGVIQLKKYRSMKQRYDDSNRNFSKYQNILQEAADDHDVGVVEDSSTSTSTSPNLNNK